MPADLVRLVYVVVLWVIVPAIMLIMLTLPLRIIGHAEDDAKASARAGFWAGLLLFVLYVVSQLPTLRVPSLAVESLPRFDLISTAIGATIGFVFLLVMRYVAPTPFVGLLTLALAAASSIALFSYVFVEGFRATVMYFALGAIFGALFFVVLFPSMARQIWD
jgi:hypothetical protein